MAAPPSRHSLAGGGPSPPPRGRTGTVGTNFSRESSKENHAPADAEEYETQRRRIEELKAELGTLRYTMRNYEQEKEMAALEKENELREARRRADDDFKSKQAAEADKARALRQAEALSAELEALRTEQDALRRTLERRARDAEEEARVLQEQLEDLSAAKDDALRMADREVKELKGQLASVQRTVQELEQDAQSREAVLQKTQERLTERDGTVAHLEADVLRLKAQTGDAETIAVIRRELTDQVTHIRTLEAANREQLTELKHLRQVHKAVEIVEEEKMSLQRQLEVAETVQTELAEERRQRQRLEDERLAWASYLQSETGTDGPIEFDSPEAMARALIQERLNSASLVEKLGGLQPEIADRDNIIQTLERERASLREQMEKLRTTSNSAAADKARIRVDRQRALAVKEVEYLRAQLKTFDTEDVTHQPESFDQKKSDRIQELEDLVDKYREEVQNLHSELTSIESSSTSPPTATTAGGKRPRPDDDNGAGEDQHEQLGQLARKNRKLQDELSTLQRAHSLLQREQSVAAGQLAAARERDKTRVLALRSNPTSDYEAVKADTLRALQRENAELLAHLEQLQQQHQRSSSSLSSSSPFATVPASQLEAARREVESARAETASAHKSARRLKEVWASKSGEFKEAIFSTLGWTVTFIPNGKMRVESVYLPSATDEHENSIVFDGERGTMKVGGGPRSPFAQRIADNIKFWVRERGCVPCFLAALTLEFYEEHTRAARPV